MTEPEFLNTSIEDLFADQMTDKLQFARFMLSLKNEIEPVIKQLESELNNANYTCWNGGGRSWNILKNQCSDPIQLSKFDELAFLEDLYDVFMISNDRAGYRKKIEYIKEIFAALVSKLNKLSTNPKCEYYGYGFKFDTDFSYLDKLLKPPPPPGEPPEEPPEDPNSGYCQLFKCVWIKIEVYKLRTTRTTKYSESVIKGDKIIVYFESSFMDINVENYRQSFTTKTCKGNELEFRIPNRDGFVLFAHADRASHTSTIDSPLEQNRSMIFNQLIGMDINMDVEGIINMLDHFLIILAFNFLRREFTSGNQPLLLYLLCLCMAKMSMNDMMKDYYTAMSIESIKDIPQLYTFHHELHKMYSSKSIGEIKSISAKMLNDANIDRNKEGISIQSMYNYFPDILIPIDTADPIRIFRKLNEDVSQFNNANILKLLLNNIMYFFTRDQQYNIEMSKFNLSVVELMIMRNIDLRRTDICIIKIIDEFYKILRNQKNIILEEIYVNVILNYDKIFDGSKHYDHLAIDFIFKRFVPEKLLADFDAIIIEKFRPYINGCILLIQQAFQNDKLDKDAFIMVAGGDAMRRYDSSMRITKDIDTKVHYIKSKETQVREIVLLMATTLACFLIVSKTMIFEHLQEVIERKNVGKDAFLTIKINALNTHIDSNQFRVRYIEKYSKLYTVDYRSYITITLQTFSGGNITTTVKHENGILDIPCVEFDELDFTVIHGERSPDIVPVASLNYLIKDIEKTYSDRDKASFRILKRLKDIKRIATLKAIKADTYYNYLDGFVRLNYDNIAGLVSFKKQLKFFKYLEKENKKLKKEAGEKFKVPFDAKLITKELQKAGLEDDTMES